jgi:hypothetical protein
MVTLILSARLYFPTFFFRLPFGRLSQIGAWWCLHSRKSISAKFTNRFLEDSMKINSSSTRFYYVTLLFVIMGLMGSMACSAQEKAEAKAKQDDFCNNWNYGDRSSFSEVRDSTVASTGSINVDGGTNGGISVIGEERGDVLIRACIQAQGKTDEEARATAKNITIHTGSTISAESTGGDQNWGVSFRIYVPRSTNLKLNTHNGGIKITGVNGSMEFEALNGGIKLSNVAGSIKGRTTNGGIKIDLSGNTWKGAGLDVQTTNGGIIVSMPDNYAAHVETGTVNGGFKSDIAGISAPEDRQNKYGAPRAVRISTDINGGGAPIRVITVNGGVKIVSASNKDEE